jgi:sugar transferase (PEP-CTERM/EpsH1 system associated)
MKQLPLVVHLVYRLDFGGLETLLVETINRMPANKYRHAIVCLTDFTDFAKKILRDDVRIYALHKAPGIALGMHIAVWRLLKSIKPTILHTYNLSTIEYTLAAFLAGVQVRIHAEHGRDANDPEGKNWKHNMLRRLLTPCVDAFVPVSHDLKEWLASVIKVPARKNILINNGVDLERFTGKSPFVGDESTSTATQPFVIGTVGRVQDVKNHMALLDAFSLLCERLPTKKPYLRLVIVGDGPLLSTLRAKVNALNMDEQVWFPGMRADIPELMKTFTVFAISSLAEGTPVVLLEAMATGLPIVSTKVGGIPDLVQNNVSGTLVPNGDVPALAAALKHYVENRDLLALHGAAGRKLVEEKYSVHAMVSNYAALYDKLCAEKIN